MKIQPSLYVSSRSDYSVASTTTTQKVETTRRQVAQSTADVVAKAPTAGLTDVSLSSVASDTTGDLVRVMLEYQKMMNQEAREDRKVAGAGAQLELMGKASKLDLENNNTTTTQKVETTRRQVAQSTADVVSKATDGGRAGFPLSSLADADTSALVLLTMMGSSVHALEDLKRAYDQMQASAMQKREIREHLQNISYDSMQKKDDTFKID
jgi:hypothetical protein